MLHLFIQIAFFVLIVAGFSVCFTAFVSLQKEIVVIPKQIQQQRTEFEALGRQIEELKCELREAEARTGVLVPPTPPKSGLNLNRRSQVLKMSRLGQKPANIAAALGLPQKEVELLLKIQKIVLSTADVPTS